MNFDDLFKPYAPEIRGDLEHYVRTHDGGSVHNLFHGPEYFFKIKEHGWMVPRMTTVRVDQSPVPDICYFVNEEYKLESLGRGHENMSLVGADEGVYDPQIILEGKNWSISHLNLEEKKDAP